MKHYDRVSSRSTRAFQPPFKGQDAPDLGVSHVPLVEQLRGHKYAKPIETMRAYLDAMDAAPYDSVLPAATTRVLAALGPRMLELAAKRSDGAHSYNVPPEHTAQARELMGAGPLLCVSV